MQGYRNIFRKQSPKDADYLQDYGQSYECQVNINCSPEGDNWQLEKEAVAMILVNGNRYCSGSLLNNTSNNQAPLFLTADHCLYGNDAITSPNLPHYSFYWHYESPNCQNSGEPPRCSTSGATILANNSISDFALLQLTENPANLQNLNFYYLGWDRNVNFSNSCIDIHHPNGDVKKISYCSNNFETTDLYSYDYNFNGAYWKTTFISTLNGFGVIEGGSSGSPLINGNRKLIAQLRGGGVTCLLNMKPVWYGRLSVSWTGANNPDIRRRLDHWLDPNNLGTQILDGIFKCNETIVNKIVNSNETIKCNKIKILNTTIQNNSRLTLQANEVIFYPGFEVKGGSELEINKLN